MVLPPHVRVALACEYIFLLQAAALAASAAPASLQGLPLWGALCLSLHVIAYSIDFRTETGHGNLNREVRPGHTKAGSASSDCWHGLAVCAVSRGVSVQRGIATMMKA